nr:reverse transcriptase domain-containing protein [Tanacetum cinerariifolium]
MKTLVQNPLARVFKFPGILDVTPPDGAWTEYVSGGVTLLRISKHRLNVREGCPPVRQKKRGQAPERTKAIQTEVEKLVEARIMREVYYHDWLSNPVMGVYCYTKMPFGLKNAGATYQRLMDRAFENQMGRNIKVYVDELVVKSHTEAKMVRDIEETFQTLRKINMKLNPKKMLIRVSRRSIPGTTEAEQAFQQLKQHLSALPLLAAPKRQEELIMYLSATHGAISAVLMTEQGTVQTPVYFISRVLQDFLNEMPSNASQGVPVAETQEEPWTLFTDGSSYVDGSGAGIILTNPDGVEFTYALRFQFAASNNEAEYEAQIAGLWIATQMGVKNIQANVDSKLVANQV